MKISSKSNNQFSVDHDFPGLCAMCYSEIANFKGSNEHGRPNITSFKGNACQLMVSLSNNSKMKIMLCNDCFNYIKPEDMGLLMESIIKGWQSEVSCLDWSEEKKADYMDKYSKLYITDRADFPYSEESKKSITKPDLNNLMIKVGE